MLDFAAMTIDNPLDAILERIEADKRGRNPVTDKVLAVGKAMVKTVVPGTGIALSILESHRAENLSLLINVLHDEFERVDLEINALEKNYREFLEGDFVGLLIDGMKKVQDLRSKERIRRIGKILANSANLGPKQSADDTEEFMRITMELADDDILVLAALCDYKPVADDIGIKDIKDFKVAGTDPEDIESILAKLQSYGLIAYIPDGIVGVDSPDYPFRVLPKGQKLLAAIINEIRETPKQTP